MQRENPINLIWKEYKQEKDKGNGKIEDVPGIGRNAFYTLVNGTTKEVEKKACLSYYYTDFLDAYEYLEQL
jgi:L-fucose mutarotase/ribose pyranase (RbsD/FucU family)